MKLRYSEFAHLIDVDAFEQAIEFDVIATRGDNDIGHCFDLAGMHKNGDTTGKFAIHREKKLFNCFLCGGGSLLSLAMELKDLDVEEATEWIHQFTDAVDTSDDDFLAEIEGLLKAEEHHQDLVLPYFNERVLKRFDHDHPWFEEKEISVDVRVEYKLGFHEAHVRMAPWRNGAPIDEPYRGPAIILPHFWGGRLVGWQERWLDHNTQQTLTPKWLPKFTNTVDFPKRETLFNWDRVQSRKHPVLILESVTSALRALSVDLPAVATFGASVTDEQLRFLRRLQQGVVICPDHDMAGEKFAATLGDYLERYIPVRIGAIPEGGPEGANVCDYPIDDIVNVVRDSPLYL